VLPFASPSKYVLVADLTQVRVWLENMIRAMKFVELITAIVALIGKLAGINAELTKQLANLRCKRPRSETLERLGRQLVLPFDRLLERGQPEKRDEPRKPCQRRRPPRTYTRTCVRRAYLRAESGPGRHPELPAM